MTADDKVQQILQAARRVLGREGYSATTISQVAAEAGVSRGLLHYYFKSKEELLARVVRANVETSLGLVATMFASSNNADELAAGLAGALRSMLESAPELFNLFFESWALARQSPVVADELQRLYQQFREAMAAGLQELVDRGAISPSLPVEGLAAVLTALVDGLGLQLTTEPELIAKPAIWQVTVETIRSMLE